MVFEMERKMGRSWAEYENWLEYKSSNTVRQYVPAFEKFLEWIDLDTEGLYDFHVQKLKSEDLRDRKNLPRKVREYQRILMVEKGFAITTVKTVEKAVRGFFEANELPFSMNGESLSVWAEKQGLDLAIKGSEKVTREELKLLLEMTNNYRDKSIITFLKDSGLRVSDLVDLKIGDIRSALDGREFFTWTMRIKKTRRYADPCLGPDAIRYLKLWMDKRPDYGLSNDDDDLLYVALERKSGYLNTSTGKTIKTTEVGDSLSSRSFATIFYNVVKRAGLKRRISAHSTRKFLQTELEYGGMPPEWVDKLTGRKTPGTSGIYRKPNPAQLIDLYSKAYHRISLEGGVDERELGLQRKRIAELEDMVARLRAGENTEVYVLRREVEELKDMLKLIYEDPEILKRFRESQKT